MSEITVPAPESESTRERLLNAAIEAFAAKGFHGTTTRDIAAAAGLSPAAVYVYHRSKEELLYVIAKGGHDITLALVITAAQSAASPEEQLAKIMHAFARSHVTRHTRARIVNYELAALTQEHFEQIQQIRRQIADQVGRVVRAGVAAGVFITSNPLMTTTALLSIGIDIARWYKEGESWTADDIADHYAMLALRIVGAPPASSPAAGRRR